MKIYYNFYKQDILSRKYCFFTIKTSIFVHSWFIQAKLETYKRNYNDRCFSLQISIMEDIENQCVLLHLEGLDNFIRHNNIQNVNIDDIINSTEKQHTVMNTVLQYLKRDKLKQKEVIKLFKMLLGIDEYQEELPPQFYDLLSSDEFLEKLLKYLDKSYTFDIQLQQLCLCVLTKILENCQDRRLLIDLLLTKFNFCSDLVTILNFCVNHNVTRETLELHYLHMISVCLNLLIVLCAEINDRSIFQAFHTPVLSCIREFIKDEDICEYGLILLKTFLCEAVDESRDFLRKGDYCIIFKVLKEHCFEGEYRQIICSFVIVLFCFNQNKVCSYLLIN